MPNFYARTRPVFLGTIESVYGFECQLGVRQRAIGRVRLRRNALEHNKTLTSRWRSTGFGCRIRYFALRNYIETIRSAEPHDGTVSMAVFGQRMALTRNVTWVLLSLAVATCVACTRRPVDHAKLNAELLQSAKKGDAASVLHLLRKGADIEARDQGASTPLALAADYGHRDVVRLLLERGADPVAGGLSGEGALAEAARVGYVTKVALVLERGADLKAKNEALFAMGDAGPALVALPAPLAHVPAQPKEAPPDIDIAKTV